MGGERGGKKPLSYAYNSPLKGNFSVHNTHKINKAGFSVTADIPFLVLLCVDCINKPLYKLTINYLTIFNFNVIPR